jgi:hypothetical protein
MVALYEITKCVPIWRDTPEPIRRSSDGLQKAMQGTRRFCAGTQGDRPTACWSTPPSSRCGVAPTASRLRWRTSHWLDGSRPLRYRLLQGSRSLSAFPAPRPGASGWVQRSLFFWSDRRGVLVSFLERGRKSSTTRPINTDALSLRDRLLAVHLLHRWIFASFACLKLRVVP